MKPAAADPFPREIEIVRGRRRTIEVTLERGRFVARVPLRAGGRELEGVLGELRRQLWERLRRENVYDQAALEERARHVARRFLSDFDLPPYEVRFSRRQHKRWGSCTFDGRRGRIRLSAALVGHPRWVVDDVLLHELIHLRVFDHGPRFHALIERNPDHARALGYLEALEHLDRTGPTVSARLVASTDDDAPHDDDARHEGGHRPQLGLFGREGAHD